MGSPRKGAASIANRVRERRRLSVDGRLSGSGIPVSGLFNRGLRHDSFECLPFGFHTDMRVMLEHSLGHVTGNVPDGLLPGAALGQVGDQSMSVVVPPAAHARFLADVAP